MIRSAVLLIPLLLPQAPTPQSPGVDPAALARAVQERYDRVRDFSADFTHTYEGGVLKKRVVERGTVQVKNGQHRHNGVAQVRLDWQMLAAPYEVAAHGVEIAAVEVKAGVG